MFPIECVNAASVTPWDIQMQRNGYLTVTRLAGQWSILTKSSAADGSLSAYPMETLTVQFTKPDGTRFVSKAMSFYVPTLN